MKQEREFFDPSSLPWRPGPGYPSGVAAVRPPGMPHGPFPSAGGCLNFEVRYRVR